MYKTVLICMFFNSIYGDFQAFAKIHNFISGFQTQL
jgi:hypothetical protein